MSESNLVQVMGFGTELVKKVSRDEEMVCIVYQWGDDFYIINFHKAGDEVEVGDWGRMHVDSPKEAIEFVQGIR